MKRILLIGGTGGLGTQIYDLLNFEYECIKIGSKECDVTNDESVSNIINKYKADVIVYLSVKNIDSLIHKHSHDTITQQLNVNLIGFLNVLRHSTNIFREKNFGRVIYISSILSQRPIRGTGIYSASKAFCDNLIKTYSLENSKYGITSNSIQLGYFDGGLTNKVPNDILDNVLKKIPLKRLGNTSEIVNLIRTIINTEYINGTNISITGGLENE
jgi:acetoacetyl-CoA reductase